jgi:hypothetical protein
MEIVMKIKIFLQSLALTAFCLWMVGKAFELLEFHGMLPLLTALMAIAVVFLCGVAVIDSQIDHQANEKSPD